MSLLIVLLLGCGQSSSEQNVSEIKDPGSKGTGVVPDRTLGVREFMENADKYTGVITIKGVVSALVMGQRLFTLIDNQEYIECGVLDCASLSLPVRWDGQMPGLETRVRVSGTVQKQGMRKVFIARELEVDPVTEDSP